jgi:outer membrane protein TolC
MTGNPLKTALRIALAALCSASAGCATYRPQPLDAAPSMQRDVARIEVDAARMPLPALRAHRFDPGDGLDIDEVAMLAVANNPRLKVARDRLGVARAQAFAAGLLPDPQLALTRDDPTGGGPGTTSAFSAGLSYDVNALLTRSARKAAAGASQRQVNLELLWQEWQVVGRARLLFVRNVEQRRLLAVLKQTEGLFATRYRHAEAALAEGNTTLDAVAADLAALQDTERQIDRLERQARRNRVGLNRLLGLAPDAELRLTGGAALPPLEPAQVRKSIAQLARRRPDLLALEAGYRSQEQRFRAAVLAQFPSLSVGITRARDTSDVYTRGLGIVLTLPIFNGNRGNVAIERATRKQLRDEYRLRLNDAAAEVYALLGDQALLRKQLAGVRSALATLEQAGAAAASALEAGNLSELAYAGVQSGLLAKRVQEITLEQRILEQRVAILTLAGSNAE